MPRLATGLINGCLAILLFSNSCLAAVTVNAPLEPPSCTRGCPYNNDVFYYDPSANACMTGWTAACLLGGCSDPEDQQLLLQYCRSSSPDLEALLEQTTTTSSRRAQSIVTRTSASVAATTADLLGVVRANEEEEEEVAEEESGTVEMASESGALPSTVTLQEDPDASSTVRRAANPSASSYAKSQDGDLDTVSGAATRVPACSFAVLAVLLFTTLHAFRIQLFHA